MFSRKRRREIIVEEQDLLTMLKVLNEVSQNSRRGVLLMDMEIGNCGWNDYPTKWYIFFDLNNKNWRSMIMNINKLNRKLILKEDTRLYLV